MSISFMVRSRSTRTAFLIIWMGECSRVPADVTPLRAALKYALCTGSAVRSPDIGQIVFFVWGELVEALRFLCSSWLC